MMWQNKFHKILHKKKLKKDKLLEEVTEIERDIRRQLLDGERISKEKEETENNYLILTTYMNKESDLEIVNEESMIKQILGEKLPNKTIQRISKKEKQIEPETKITSSNNILKQVIEPEKIISGNYNSKPLKQKKKCKLCRIKVPLSEYNNHLESIEHKKNGQKNIEQKRKCKLCSIKVPLSEYNNHLESIEHKKNDQNKVHCNVCNKYFTQQGYSSHISGKSHRKKTGQIKSPQKYVNQLPEVSNLYPFFQPEK